MNGVFLTPLQLCWGVNAATELIQPQCQWNQTFYLLIKAVSLNTVSNKPTPIPTPLLPLSKLPLFYETWIQHFVLDWCLIMVHLRCDGGIYKPLQCPSGFSWIETSIFRESRDLGINIDLDIDLTRCLVDVNVDGRSLLSGILNWHFYSEENFTELCLLFRKYNSEFSYLPRDHICRKADAAVLLNEIWLKCTSTGIYTVICHLHSNL